MYTYVYTAYSDLAVKTVTKAVQCHIMHMLLATDVLSAESPADLNSSFS